MAKTTGQLLHIWQRSNEFRRMRAAVEADEGPCALFGVGEAPAVHIAAAMLDQNTAQALIVTAGEEEAMRLSEEMSLLIDEVVYFPAREIQLQRFFAASRELSTKRIVALSQLYDGTARICVASIEAVMQSIAPRKALFGAHFSIALGQTLPIPSLLDRLSAAGYERVEQVDGAGQFRASGGILDIFVPGEPHPFRIEFFDDEVDSIRVFDLSTQRSSEKRADIKISSATEVPCDSAVLESARSTLAQWGKKAAPQQAECLAQLQDLLDGQVRIEGAENWLPLFYEPTHLLSHLQPDAAVLLFEPNRLEERAKELHEQFLQKLSQGVEDGVCLAPQESLLLGGEQVIKSLDTPKTLCIAALSRRLPVAPRVIMQLEARSAAQYHANIEALAKDLQQMRRSSAVVMCAGKRAEKLRRDLVDFGVDTGVARSLSRQAMNGEVLVLETAIARGFESGELRVSVLSEQDIYGSRKRATKTARKARVNKLDLFADLKIGDYVVHEQYGIGVFCGLETHTAAGKSRDFLMIQYAGRDRVGVSTDELDRVQKFIGNADKTPRLSKLGGADWTRTVSKVRASVKALAFDLVALYAERQAETGFAFSTDTPWQRQLEDAFPYEETPGQLQAIDEIKRDMESGRAMDRLLCGDVGYGKTELAVRAAFKAVQDSKQVAVLVPTTLLAQQHYHTFLQRFDGFPVSVGLLSRMRTAKQQRETLTALKEGRIDVLIGTHALLGKNVAFKDLGLLIVDEEQRFGVGHKETIKQLKKNIDVLTLSATPIPRTLHMAMVGIRDMSVIETPPEERFPVQTYVMEYADSLVTEAVRKEMAHGGQTYILYNQVADMERFIAGLSALLPEAGFAMAHGQMPQAVLEKTMMDFLEKEYDVLVCSSIIESGLDIPNVNTIIVYDADRFGLSQLYQLRGRVGRSNRLAYAYLTFRRDKVLSEVAEKRLRAIREFTEFGSGYKIAMRDLEIRGAGNIIGAQQHGHMDEVGYDLYCRLIEQAVREVRGEQEPLQVETQIDISLNAHIPHDYVAQEAQRLEMYKRIAGIGNLEDMYDVQEELEDRFGEIPPPVQSLLDIALFKARAKAAQIERVTLRAQEARFKMHPNADIDVRRLFEVLNDTPDCTITPGKDTQIRLFKRSATPEEMFTLAGELTLRLMECSAHGT